MRPLNGRILDEPPNDRGINSVYILDTKTSFAFTRGKLGYREFRKYVVGKNVNSIIFLDSIPSTASAYFNIHLG